MALRRLDTCRTIRLPCPRTWWPRAVPPERLSATDGSAVSLAERCRGRRVVVVVVVVVVVFAYPRTGQPGVEPLVPDWDSIPGARGCTPQACGFRDLAAEFESEGVEVSRIASCGRSPTRTTPTTRTAQPVFWPRSEARLSPRSRALCFSVASGSLVKAPGSAGS